jgi:hypothetical protein
VCWRACCCLQCGLCPPAGLTGGTAASEACARLLPPPVQLRVSSGRCLCAPPCGLLRLRRVASRRAQQQQAEEERAQSKEHRTRRCVDARVRCTPEDHAAAVRRSSRRVPPSCARGCSVKHHADIARWSAAAAPATPRLLTRPTRSWSWTSSRTRCPAARSAWAPWSGCGSRVSLFRFCSRCMRVRVLRWLTSCRRCAGARRLRHAVAAGARARQRAVGGALQRARQQQQRWRRAQRRERQRQRRAGVAAPPGCGVRAARGGGPRGQPARRARGEHVGGACCKQACAHTFPIAATFLTHLFSGAYRVLPQLLVELPAGVLLGDEET